MDYLVDFTITIPDDASPAEIEQRLAGETTHVAELAAQGHALRVWKPLPDDGHRRALGLYRAASDDELETILDSLPLRPWMEISVTALAKHPNDPAQSTVWRANATRRPHHRPVGTTRNALPNPQLRHVYRLDAELDAPIDLGDTPQGRRRIIPLTRGHATGPYFDAELLPAGGADWQIVRAGGSSVADIRYTLKTAGGALLYVQSQGVRHGDPGVLARLAAGEDVDPSEYTFRTSVTIETADAELAWVNDGVFIAVGGRRPNGVSYNVYLVA
jgi:muconolactone delta-isomerase